MRKVTSGRRAKTLSQKDYDHEIGLIDHDRATPSAQTPNPDTTQENTDISRSSTTAGLLQSSRRQNEGEASQTDEARIEEQDVEDNGHHDVEPSGPDIEVQGATPYHENGPSSHANSKKQHQERETAIDILYENERGGFLCGAPLFSSAALGGLDASPWTNQYHKSSVTSIHTATVPDPSWEWVWPEWKINVQDGTDAAGWEYSFAYSKKFSWHKARWYNSFVRRRAWIRKRAKRKDADELTNGDIHMLNPDYFHIRPASTKQKLSQGSLSSRASMSQVSSLTGEDNEQGAVPEIHDVDALLLVLRRARIDREKLEAVESYIEHAEDLMVMQDHMHDIMSAFVFQASRRLLLSHLMRTYDTLSDQLKNKAAPTTPITTAEGKKDGRNSSDSNPRKSDDSPYGRRDSYYSAMETTAEDRKDALAAAVKHADEEVRRLAYWSDVKEMAEAGESTGAVDGDRGWDEERWEGIDQSGPGAPNRGGPPEK